MTPDELTTSYPRLYHMAAEGSWPAIRRAGLLTTRQLVDISTTSSDVRDEVLGKLRPRSVTLEHPSYGVITVRDQGPLREQFLAACLVGMTIPEWLDVLNGRVFFWLSSTKLDTLLGARRYRSSSHDVLTIDTASLVHAHADRIRLSPINSGATLYPNAPSRGPQTFLTVSQYPWKEYRRRKSVIDAVTELAVIDGVPDIADHVIRVERRQCRDVIEVLFTRQYPGSGVFVKKDR